MTDYLRSIINDRFDIHDLPDGFFYLPIAQGGVELRNPFISLFAIRENILKNPAKKLEKAFDQDELMYNAAIERFEKGAGRSESYLYDQSVITEADKKGFMSLEEYNRYREETSHHLANVYQLLLQTPQEQDVAQTPDIAAAWTQLEEDKDATAASMAWETLPAYDKWVAQLYAGEVLKKFGTLRIVDQGAVPFGVISMLKKGKVKWQG